MLLKIHELLLKIREILLKLRDIYYSPVKIRANFAKTKQKPTSPSLYFNLHVGFVNFATATSASALYLHPESTAHSGHRHLRTMCNGLTRLQAEQHMEHSAAPPLTNLTLTSVGRRMLAARPPCLYRCSSIPDHFPCYSYPTAHADFFTSSSICFGS